MDEGGGGDGGGGDGDGGDETVSKLTLTEENAQELPKIYHSSHLM